jgi:hypothetical protein
MTLKEEQVTIISERPLSDTLNNIREKLRDNDAEDLRQDDIASLPGALVVSPAAFSLPCPDRSGNVAVRLLSIKEHVREGVVKLDHFLSLVRHVVDKSPDIDIWQAVFNIIETLSPATRPPSSVALTFRGTPVKTSSSRLTDSETSDIVKGELFQEIRHCTFRNVGGF